MNQKKLKGQLPAGSLQQANLELWRSAGYKIGVKERSLFPTIDDPELDLILVRPQEIPRYVAEGKADFGITGSDCIAECECEDRVVEMAELVFSKVSRKPTRWVLAVSQDSPIQGLQDLNGTSIDAEFVTMTNRWLSARGIQATVRYSWGATEVKPGRFCDAIVESTETGESLMRNGLRIVAEVMQSTPRFIANPVSFADPWKREKMEDIVLMLQGALAAEGKACLTMHVREENLETILPIIPALRSPTVSRLASEGWFSLTAIIDEMVVRVIIPKLKRAGAEGIIESPISKLIM
ncbi:MAG TPA: ATP phosphoribosyltransferase [Candidatus Peribacterales bacterium]|nr:ATP phosphoribosyltransferase [Candidatus Peribacterales bacterium]